MTKTVGTHYPVCLVFSKELVSVVFEAFCETFGLAYGAYLNGFLDFCDYFIRLGSESQVILNMATPLCRINNVRMIFSTVVVFFVLYSSRLTQTLR